MDLSTLNRPAKTTGAAVFDTPEAGFEPDSAAGDLAFSTGAVGVLRSAGFGRDSAAVGLGFSAGAVGVLRSTGFAGVSGLADSLGVGEEVGCGVEGGNDG